MAALARELCGVVFVTVSAGIFGYWLLFGPV